MWIVRLALRRPYSVGVMAIFILIMGILSIRSMLVDIFPTIDIPVVVMVWNYPGLSAEEMEKRVVFISERGTSTTVNGVDHIESQSIPGIGIVKVYFQPGTDIGAAIAQMTAVSNSALRIMPPGMQPPAILQLNATNVPVAQLTLSSKKLSEEKIFDYALNFIRLRLFTVPGLSTPAPYGGKQRQINIDLDPNALRAKGVSPSDVLTALQNSNLIIPAGTARIGAKEYNIGMNSSPEKVTDFKSIPIKVVNNEVVTIGMVGKVGDAFADQSNVVRVNRHRSAYMVILKKAGASTLAVVESAKSMLPLIQKEAPDGLEIQVDFDQSVFVKSAINNVLHEAIIASILVSLMILFFLGSWRSVIIVCTSIPLSILVGIIGLKLTGNTLNIMTLGGLSLAIGMLVDDATVEVENIHRNRLLGKPLTVAILTGAEQVAVPALAATLAICIVFFPVVLLTGPSRYLFTSMALSVVISMMTSYFLSRTLVTASARMLMEHEHLHDGKPYTGKKFWEGLSVRFNNWRDKRFNAFKDRYGRALQGFLNHRKIVLSFTLLLLVVSMGLFKIVGSDFFPTTDTGLMKMHFRAPSGTRNEETERLTDSIEARIEKIIPANELKTVNDMLGVPSFYNLAFVPTDNSGGMDAEILISLKEGHQPTALYRQKIRADLNAHFPGCEFYFQSADVVSQVLNFGLSAPIDVQIEGRDYVKSYEVARKLRDAMKTIPGTADVTIKQIIDYPTLHLDVNREVAARNGLTQRDISNSMLISLASSALVGGSFYLSPINNVNYTVVVKTPLEKLKTVPQILETPITAPVAFNSTVIAQPTDAPQAKAQTLGNLANLSSENQFNLINHSTVQRVMDINANVEGRDLGSVAEAIQKKIDGLGELPKGMRIRLRGQNEVMNESFSTLGMGIILAMALVYLLMVMLFQSWLDPLIIMVAVPGALAGVLWMLVITGTTINVVSLMGAIVAIGIAVSNSILLVNFANELRIDQGLNPFEAALEAGKTRLRPVLMTALAMVLGMIPMAIGSGEGGEQNAPLGRAVIGGLLLATIVTLFIVPIVYAVLRKATPSAHALDAKFEMEANEISEATAHEF